MSCGNPSPRAGSGQIWVLIFASWIRPLPCPSPDPADIVNKDAKSGRRESSTACFKHKLKESTDGAQRSPLVSHSPQSSSSRPACQARPEARAAEGLLAVSQPWASHSLLCGLYARPPPASVSCLLSESTLELN